MSEFLQNCHLISVSDAQEALSTVVSLARQPPQIRQRGISYIDYMRTLKTNDANGLSYRNGHGLTDLEKELMVARWGWVGGRVVREFGMDLCTLL